MIDSKKFAIDVLASNKVAFVINISNLMFKMLMYLVRKIQIALLLAKKIRENKNSIISS